MKICPKCSNNHIKPGIFCSMKCSNSRTWTESDKLKKSIASKNSVKVKIAAKNRALRQRLRRKYTPCKYCKVDIEVIYKNNRQHCNSKECRIKQASDNGKISAKNRSIRSKQEIELHNLCKKYFSNIKSNEPIANGWDADVLLFDHKIAILWNGPWHYREMNMSNHSLKQVVNRDILKIIEFEKIGWKVIIYEDNKWTPETAFVDLILEIGRTVRV